MGTSKALLFGINYVGTESALRGCANDVMNMGRFLREVGAFDNIQIYTDEIDPSQVTGEAIYRHLETLARESEKGLVDRVWIHYSGHGAQVRDWSGDERDNMDECILPVDFAQRGVITDDSIKRILRMFHKETKVTCVFDCCHSGTICDLKYNYASNIKKTCVNTFADPCKAEICVISGCMDKQTSADAYNVRGRHAFSGAMTSCLLDVMRYETKSKIVLNELNKKLRYKGFEQVAQMSSSSDLDLTHTLY
jgi:hypothetical protein